MKGRPPLPPGRWSLLYSCCRECGRTWQRHEARGLCATCYRRPLMKARWERLKRQKARQEAAAAR
jgi:DNA-directed RNA polymerase subunit RPC12/RpoP